MLTERSSSMTSNGKALVIGVLTFVFLPTLMVEAFGQDGRGPETLGGAFRGMTLIWGKILCVDCTIDEVRKAQPAQHDLYELQKDGQRAVLQVMDVEDSASGRESLLGQWEAVTGSVHELAVRGDSSLCRQLTTEENVQREVEITG